MEQGMSFGVERNVLVDELQYYFEQAKAADGKQIEYQGYIYTIYSPVCSNTEHLGIVLMQILKNTDYLITGLKKPAFQY